VAFDKEKSLMKKWLSLFIALFVFSSMAQAQTEIGFHFGSGIGLQLTQNLGSGTALRFDFEPTLFRPSDPNGARFYVGFDLGVGAVFDLVGVTENSSLYAGPMFVLSYIAELPIAIEASALLGYKIKLTPATALFAETRVLVFRLTDPFYFSLSGFSLQLGISFRV
jgi:hypothetical protein